MFYTDKGFFKKLLPVTIVKKIHHYKTLIIVVKESGEYFMQRSCFTGMHDVTLRT